MMETVSGKEIPLNGLQSSNTDITTIEELTKNSAFFLLKQVRRLKNENIELEDKNIELEKKSITDDLTGLNNRQYFNEKIKELISLNKRTKNPFSVIFFDIDFFKMINDNFGHSIGDSVIIGIAEIIQKKFRMHDIKVRRGGDEFGIIMPDTDKESAIIKAESFRKIIEKTLATYLQDATSINSNCDNKDCKKRILCGGEGLVCLKEQLTCSIGVASLRKDDTAETLLDRVDKALYKSKGNGRNNVTDGEINYEGVNQIKSGYSDYE